MKAAYLDASAAVKLIRSERETSALEEALRGEQTLVSSVLLDVEVRCTARRIGGADMLSRVDHLLGLIELVAWTDAIRERAGQAFAPPLRTLDALHAATALALAAELRTIYVYDLELRSALQSERLKVESPGFPT